MIRPYIYAVCDQIYRQAFADAFLNSAHAAGHEADVFCDGKIPNNQAKKARYTGWRFRMLPEILTKHSHVLVLDVDSVIRRPVEFAPEYDLGLFLRMSRPEEYLKTFAAAFYITDKAKPFADELARAMTGTVFVWGDDQAILWRTYRDHGGAYNLKPLGRETIDWDHDSKAPIYTAKGSRKGQEEFASEVMKWRKHKQGAAA